MNERIVLASGSPRRRQLLEWAGIGFDVIVSNADESYPPEMPVDEVPVFVARNKALAVQSELSQERIILAADTVVVLGDEIIGKPRDREDAVSILSRLQDHEHRVITGVVMIRDDREIAFADSTAVWFHPLSRTQIEWYVDQYKPYDKAGAYAIQEWIGVVGIRSISGDFYNVMGLPVSRVFRELNGLLAESLNG